jgi:hypothetical protein
VPATSSLIPCYASHAHGWFFSLCIPSFGLTCCWCFSSCVLWQQGLNLLCLRIIFVLSFSHASALFQPRASFCLALTYSRPNPTFSTTPQPPNDDIDPRRRLLHPRQLRYRIFDSLAVIIRLKSFFGDASCVCTFCGGL